ncbi:MAG: hypothetical protein ABF391_02170 [Akkermansiaceae bacterium]
MNILTNKHVRCNESPAFKPEVHPVQAQIKIPSGYGDLIHEATGASRDLLLILEEIMRTEIFHSTLDWQSVQELHDGARKAFSLYEAHRAFYDADRRWRQALLRLEVAERTLETLKQDQQADPNLARSLTELEVARFEEAAACATFTEFLTS